MWWGGGQVEDPVSGESSSANTTPPIDIMAEEALESASSIISEDVSDISDLKEQFAAQEGILSQLQNVLKSNEEKLHIKEKEVKVYPVCALFNTLKLLLNCLL